MYFIFHKFIAMILPKNIFIWCDHAAIEEKNKLITYVKNERNYKDITVIDEGACTPESVDYPDIAKKVCHHVLKIQDSVWVLICGTGGWMSMAANKIEGIRALLIHNRYTAGMSKKHGDCNVACFGAREGLFDDYQYFIDAFLNGQFEAGRHQKRIDKLTHDYMNNK